MIWHAQFDSVASTLGRGRSIIFIGGRGTGSSTICTELVNSLDGPGRQIRLLSLSTQPELAESQEAFLTATFGIAPEMGVPAVPGLVDELARRAAAQEFAREVVLVDGIHHLRDREWGAEMVDYLRAVLSESRHVVLGLFGRPSLSLLFEGTTSPLSNLCSRFRAQPCDRAAVREHFALRGVEAAVSMKAHRLVGGNPELLPDVVGCFESGMDQNEAAAELLEKRTDFFAAQFSDLSPRGQDAALEIAVQTRSLDGLRDCLGGGPVDGPLGELSASLLVSQENGTVSLSSEVHRCWLELEHRRRKEASRPPLSALDDEAYRLISRLEWQGRKWLADRLSQACPEDWWSERIPEAARDRASERLDAERASEGLAASDHLVDYLDFGDIREIVRYRLNRLTIFEPIAGSLLDAFEEAMARLEAVRRKVAHSRPIDDSELRTAQDCATIVHSVFER